MSATLTGSYDPSQVVVAIGGVIVTGFSDGDSIVARMAEDKYFTRVGNDGGVGRARNASALGEIEIKLLQTSGANAALSALFNTDDLVNGGLAVIPVSVVDGSGFSLATASQAWIKSMPEMVLGKEVGERTWVLSCADLRMLHGGNSV